MGNNKETLMPDAVKAVTDILDKTVALMGKYAPPTNLTRKTYLSLTESSIQDLVQEHGEVAVKKWVTENQAKDGFYG